MKKPTAAEIAQEFARAAAKAQRNTLCGPCKLSPEYRDAIPLCFQSGMSSAELSRQILAKTGKRIDPLSLRNHYRYHCSK